MNYPEEIVENYVSVRTGLSLLKFSYNEEDKAGNGSFDIWNTMETDGMTWGTNKYGGCFREPLTCGDTVSMEALMNN